MSRPVGHHRFCHNLKLCLFIYINKCINVNIYLYFLCIVGVVLLLTMENDYDQVLFILNVKYLV